jgi:hypothetical protein
LACDSHADNTLFVFVSDGHVRIISGQRAWLKATGLSLKFNFPGRHHLCNLRFIFKKTDQ